ncbi:glycerophosphodiester phosphodiesterase [candidate division KSB1 bacterium]|nr:glycerophosphodiester phosphodiesterase [candidate division KSB1 bacterium]
MNINHRGARIILLLLILFIMIGCKNSESQNQIQRTLVIAHRGSSAEYPENTLAAFKAAVDVNADYIELDVHLSKDGEIVVLHDDTIDRTTDGTGFVSDYTVAELRGFDAGSWFDPKFKDEHIPTLLEAIEVVENTQTRLCVEIKEKEKKHYPGLEKRLVEIIHQNDLIGHLVVTSYNKNVVKNLKELEPKVAIAYDPNDGEYKEFQKQAAQCPVVILNTGANMACFNHKNLSDEIISECLYNGVPLWVWTVDDEGRMKELVTSGIEAIMTNKPDVLRHVVDQHLAR